MEVRASRVETRAAERRREEFGAGVAVGQPHGETAPESLGHEPAPVLTETRTIGRVLGDPEPVGQPLREERDVDLEARADGVVDAGNDPGSSREVSAAEVDDSRVRPDIRGRVAEDLGLERNAGRVEQSGRVARKAAAASAERFQ